MFLHDVAGAAKAEMAASKSRTLEEEHLAAALAVRIRQKFASKHMQYLKTGIYLV